MYNYWARRMSLEYRATNWFACFNDTRDLLVKAGRQKKDTYLAKANAEQLLDFEETEWKDYFRQSESFISDYINRRIKYFEGFRPIDFETARSLQDKLALTLFDAKSSSDLDYDETVFFAYATLGISRDLADARRPFVREIERGLYVCYADDLLRLPTDPRDRGMFIKQP